MNANDESQSPDVFDIDRIRRLVELMEQHDLSQVDLRQGAERIRLTRGAEPVAFPAAPAAVPPAPAPSPQPPATGQGAAPEAASADGPNIVTITAPMVGTLYLRPNPESDHFVSVGSTVTADTTVCIIEAMKVFNEIPAEVRGKVVAVLAQNEEPVEFGKPLFKIDTSA